MDVPHISPLVLRFFRRIVRGYFRRHFTAVRLSRASLLNHLPDRRLIVYANHGSWWDPMICVLLGEALMPERAHFAPMDAEVLAGYGILKRVGVFGVQMATARGAANFLRGGMKILASEGVLWITPQGRFADARERPLSFKLGMAALAVKTPEGCTVQPLAIEYVFWNRRLPEVLLHFGEAVRVQGGDTRDANPRLETALLEAMETLQKLALARDESAFIELAHGQRGSGGFYSIFERLRAKLRRPGVTVNGASQ